MNPPVAARPAESQLTAEEKQARRADEIISMKSKLLLNPNMLQKLLHASLRSKE